MQLWPDIKRIDSSDTNVSKFVFTKPDAVAEAVLYKYPTYADRTVICCSTQSGCPVGCRFCGAGDSFVRSLTTDEIIEQPVHLLAEVACTTGTTQSPVAKAVVWHHRPWTGRRWRQGPALGHGLDPRPTAPLISFIL